MGLGGQRRMSLQRKEIALSVDMVIRGREQQASMVPSILSLLNEYLSNGWMNDGWMG